MACLLLASKSEDVPKRVADIIRECWRAKHEERHDTAGRVELSRPDDKVGVTCGGLRQRLPSGFARTLQASRAAYQNVTQRHSSSSVILMSSVTRQA